MTRNRTNALALLVGIALVLSGAAGVGVGGISAQAGWWCVIVGSIIGLVAVYGLLRGRSSVPH